jgi:hypothetical protein
MAIEARSGDIQRQRKRKERKKKERKKISIAAHPHLHPHSQNISRDRKMECKRGAAGWLAGWLARAKLEKESNAGHLCSQGWLSADAALHLPSLQTTSLRLFCFAVSFICWACFFSFFLSFFRVSACVVVLLAPRRCIRT